MSWGILKRGDIVRGILERGDFSQGDIVWGDFVLGDIVRGDIVLIPCVCVCVELNTCIRNYKKRSPFVLMTSNFFQSAVFKEIEMQVLRSAIHTLNVSRESGERSCVRIILTTTA